MMTLSYVELSEVATRWAQRRNKIFREALKFSGGAGGGITLISAIDGQQAVFSVLSGGMAACLAFLAASLFLSFKWPNPAKPLEVEDRLRLITVINKRKLW